ncbi:hypothetical protein BDZ97DRAFT_1916231 [Flammula alnicola]|nr:hypothetical protein BDZ97DRAFT_1916231 [Flammula alnicola]
MFANLFNLSLLAVVLPITALGSSHGNLLNRHHHSGLAKRQEGNVSLLERGPGSRWSFYNVETGSAGSCGTFHTNADFTVAMNVAQMNDGLCYKNIKMTYNGKTTVASITDTCPGCPYGGLDLTEGLFQYFAPASVGIIYGDWELDDGSAAPAPAPTPTPKPTPKPSPTPTTTWTPPPPPPPTTTSVWKAPSTTSVHKTTSTIISSSSSKTTTKSSTTPASSTTLIASSSINYASGAASGLAVPTGTIDGSSGTAQNLVGINQVFIQMGGVVAAGAQV